ncbi:MAG: hypothetical protein BroJett025_00400 [Patescibacteria group bacterium]|nr:MAG: hypothetical protein BroJett025_00400 [Patescibacteria group bacterium]
MKLEETSAPYSRETLARLAKMLEKYEVLPWLNPATNAISIKDFSFMQHRPFMQVFFPQE